jgi:hypothetical protein
MPDQFTPVRRTSRPAASSSCDPRALNGPEPTGSGVGEGLGTGVWVGVGVALGGSGVAVAGGGGGKNGTQPLATTAAAVRNRPGNCRRRNLQPRVRINAPYGSALAR